MEPNRWLWADDYDRLRYTMRDDHGHRLAKRCEVQRMAALLMNGKQPATPYAWDLRDMLCRNGFIKKEMHID